MNLRQIVRAFRTNPGNGVAGPEIDFIAIRAASIQASGGPLRGGGLVTLTYAAVMAVNVALGNLFVVTPTDGVAFAFSVPTNPPTATVVQRIQVQIVNTFGVLGAATFTGGAGGFRIGAAWVQPANGFNRTIEFEWSGSVWREANRTAADVAN